MGSQQVPSVQIPSIKILFLCTAHNSLSQRLSLVLQEHGHHVTVELAISPEIMIQASEIAKPDLIICPFLTKKVPAEVYEKYLTLIIHPGPPGDAGPSAIDWVLLGDDGTEPDAVKALAELSENQYVESGRGRTHWGVTVLQAIEEFDAGPVWAWNQFPISLDGPHALTKAALYRGPVTQAAIDACLVAIQRIISLAGPVEGINCNLPAPKDWSTACANLGKPFLGGSTRTRPLLKPTERAWDPSVHSSTFVSRRLRASDSQPGVQSKLFGDRSLYLYGGIIEEKTLPVGKPGEIVAQRASAVLVRTADGKGIWITHVRRLKPKAETLLPAKLPAMLGLRSIPELALALKLDEVPVWELDGFVKAPGTFQETWIEYENLAGGFKTAFVYSEFYNGAASTEQCQSLCMAIKEALRPEHHLKALVLMGGGYWNNGIHLGVCSTDVGAESWKNINAINDCVQAILEQTQVVTFAGIRGNAAAGGFALATCCDFVFSVDSAVINPHYRAVGLYGSEYHTLTWYSRAGEDNARKFLRGMLPMSAIGAQRLGLVDRVLEGGASNAVDAIRKAVTDTLAAPAHATPAGAPWTRSRCGRPTHADVWQAVPRRKEAWLGNLPQPLSEYRHQELDFMKYNFTDPRYHACVAAFTGKGAPRATPLRFALHRRFVGWYASPQLDPEEAVDYFGYPSPPELSEIDEALKLTTDRSRPIQLIPPPVLRRFSNASAHTPALVGSPSSPISSECHPSGDDQQQQRSPRLKIKDACLRIKAVFIPKEEKKLNQSPTTNPLNTRRLSLFSSSSPAPSATPPLKADSPSHEMACYYNAVEAA